MWHVMNVVLAVSSIKLNNIPDLDILLPNCEPTMQFHDTSAELINLVAVFRHGDRAPLKIKTHLWKNKICVTCGENCRREKCDDGMVTLKGFIQSKRLGEFISKQYIPRFKKLDSIEAFRSTLNRSYTTLKGVFEGMETKDIPIQIEKSLMNSSITNSVKNFILKESKADISPQKNFEYSQFDNLVTAYCSDTPFLCKDSDCEPNGLVKTYNEQLTTFLNAMEVSKKNFITTGISLGDLGDFIKKETLKEGSISLVSSHDSTLIKLLQGLNVQIDFVPPYSSVIFIEVWKNFDGKKFVRVIYEGKIMEIGLYKENLVELKNFIQYLDMFNIPNAELKKMPSYEEDHPSSAGKIKHLAQMTKKAYMPILTEIRNDADLKNNNFLNSLIFDSFQKIKNSYSFVSTLLREHAVGSRAYLFGWSKKNKVEMIEIKQTIEDDDGQIAIHTIQCPKNGKGDCKTISKQRVSSTIEPATGNNSSNGNINSNTNNTNNSNTVAQPNKASKDQDSTIKIVTDANCKFVAPQDGKFKLVANETKAVPEEKIKVVNNEVCKPKPEPIPEPQCPCDKPPVDTSNNSPCTDSNKTKSTGCPNNKASPCDQAQKPDDCNKTAKQETPCDKKPAQTAFKGLPGEETLFKTQGCNIKAGPVPQAFFGARPSPCGNPSPMMPRINPPILPNNQMPCGRIIAPVYFPEAKKPIRFANPNNPMIFQENREPMPCFRPNASIPCPNSVSNGLPAFK